MKLPQDAFIEFCQTHSDAYFAVSFGYYHHSGAPLSWFIYLRNDLRSLHPGEFFFYVGKKGVLELS